MAVVATEPRAPISQTPVREEEREEEEEEGEGSADMGSLLVVREPEAGRVGRCRSAPKAGRIPGPVPCPAGDVRPGPRPGRVRRAEVRRLPPAAAWGGQEPFTGSSLIRMLRNDTWSDGPWFWSPM
ncbi:hypothetical protein GCM10009549_15650 [Streptomyces thermoalcalitolerans]|uniref:Uncharacterized protein n=1 Tax=Streptomyces thermoalcalitolerans TaxID=65605 RepID=A0ABN1NHT9_9ACTN